MWNGRQKENMKEDKGPNGQDRSREHTEESVLYLFDCIKLYDESAREEAACYD